ncbi:hypothetical protein PLESTB_000158100 [Pleodorina starrii]|uniref:BSD domain-containing protein n=1 Tax=Pleodorina starrii TaxID=330485 RepID=A0A9W6BC75_9CHLO|nr:hypothetical protein PLESTB_000158100 [Pleodorina starrii]
MAHEQQLIVKRAWLGPGGPEGFLIVASSSLRWQPAPGSAQPGQELRIPLAAITNNQRAKDKPLVRITVATAQLQQQQQQQQQPPAGPAQQHHVFQFESVADRDAALDVLTKVIAALVSGPAAANGSAGAAGGKGAGGPGDGPAVAGGFSRPQRQQMLARDADLRALWEELVGGGVLSEADFWGGVASRLAAAQPAAWGTAAGGGSPAGSGAMAAGGPRRRVGLSNILQRLEAEVDGRHQRVLRVSLAPEQVAQIFAEQPAVLRAYREHVPHRMSEEDFWRRYVRHEMHKESKRKARAEGLTPAAAAASVVDDAGGDIFREAAAAVAAEAAARPGAAAAHRERVDPTLDLMASEGERYQGFGLAHAATREPELDSERHRLAASQQHHHDAAGLGLGLAGLGLEDPDDLAAAINRHGQVVLQGVEALAQVEAQLRSAPGAPAPPGSNNTAAAAAAGRAGAPAGAPGGSAAAAAAGPGPGSSATAGGGEDDGGEPHRRRRRHSAGLHDLQEPAPPQLDSLSIADPRRYFERMKDQAFGGPQGSGGGGGWPGGGGGWPGGGLAGAAAVLAAVQPGCLRVPPMDPAAAEAALLEATPLARALAEDEAAGPGGSALPRAGGAGSRDPASSVPPETLAFLRRTVLAVNEACRHFWRSLPANTAARREKAARLAKLLEAKRSEVEALNDRARGVEGRFIRQLLKPPMDMLLGALVRWDEEVQKRGGVPTGHS